MRIPGVKTHIVDTLIPEEHRVRSGTGYKLRRTLHAIRDEVGVKPDVRSATVIPDRTSTSLA